MKEMNEMIEMRRKEERKGMKTRRWMNEGK